MVWWFFFFNLNLMPFIIYYFNNNNKNLKCAYNLLLKNRINLTDLSICVLCSEIKINECALLAKDLRNNFALETK